MRLCHGVFTGHFIFRTVLARVLNIFKFQKPVSKTYRPKNVIFFCLLITFSFPFLISYSSNALIDMVDILFSREKVP